MGFTHLEFLPISERPFDPSWGYQPTGLFAPTARFGDPAGFARFVDAAHNAGLGIMLGCSRIGGIVGPLLGGYVIGAGVGRFSVMLLFGGLMVLPATATLMARLRATQQQSEPVPA